METVDKITQELALWKPQKLALTKLHATLQPIDFSQDLDTIKASIPGSLNFDTEFPSFTFDMATGTGKTRLMGACIAYLYQKKKSRNFFVLAPGETIYRKLIEDFSKGKKCVFKGWSDIPNYDIITGDNYERYNPAQQKLNSSLFTIFIFNIDKFRRRDKETLKFHKFREALGSSFGDLIAQLQDLILIMDESHHYRADITKEAVKNLKPILGLEFTATPLYKKNIIYSYSLGDAVKDGIVKHLEAIIRKNDRSYEEELEELKLLDGFELHEHKKAYLGTYCKNHNRKPIKSLVFITTKNIKHGTEIQNKIESKDFLNGKYKNKTVFIHSGSEDEQIQELLKLEEPSSDKEVVIHVNKLKEGWDVKNIYTIIPLRASISQILVEQTIGRGVRLPFYDIDKEEIELDPKAFTLSVITYKLKGDNYKDVIRAANKNNIRVKDYDEDEDKGKKLETYEIKPTNKKYAIKIPIITSDVVITGRLKSFNITPSHTDLTKKIKTSLTAVDLIDEKSEDLGVGAQTALTVNQFKFLVNKLIENTPELDFKDKSTVEKITTIYLKKVESDKNKWEDLLKKQRRIIFEDIQRQIQDKISETIKVKHKLELDYYKFSPYNTTIEEGGLLKKQQILEEEIKRKVITGYKRSVYVENTFDSKQEKWFADIVDKDKLVKKWLKNPVRQIAIKYKFGNYYTDFFVEASKENYVIEIKSSAELKNPLVIEKAREAAEWCKLASKKTGKKWLYKIIPHDKIKRQDSFKGVISTAVKF